MTNQVLLIDLENVQKVDLSLVPGEARVLVFYGVTQKKLPEELVVQAQPFGARLKWIKISGQGPNALDFHIAFYLGQELAHRPTSECTIFSRDMGFDPPDAALASARSRMQPSTVLEGSIRRSTARDGRRSLQAAHHASEKRESAPHKAQGARRQSEVLVSSPDGGDAFGSRAAPLR
jgi:hypothetical protein